MRKLLVFLILFHASNVVFAAQLPIDSIEPGKTQLSELKQLLGKPLRMVREGATQEYYFYGLGEGSTLDATVHVRSGTVQYVTYLCSEALKDIEQRYKSEPSIHRTLETRANGYSGKLSQVLYETRGRGFIYEPKSRKIKACVAWTPGKKFDQLGN